MTLNSNYAGATQARGRLEGSDRALDALVGLVILLAEVFIGVLVLFALFQFGAAQGEIDPYASDGLEVGYGIALFGSIIVVGITTLVYLVRIAVGRRRSWPAPLWGLILMGIALLVGFVIMSSGV